MNAAINSDAIRDAATAVGAALASFDISDRPLHVFSERHETAMRRILSAAAGRKRRRPFARQLAACLVIVLLLFACAYMIIPSIHATVNGWFTTVWNNIVTYYFPHSGNDHAFPVITPTGIPCQFELESDDNGDGYRTLKYVDKTNDDYIVFDYRWISRKKADKLKQSIEKNGSVSIWLDYKALLNEKTSKTSLEWYEPHNMLGFRAESDLPSEELIQAFSALDWHLPDYGPTWIPEGFELIDEYRDPGCASTTYYDPESGSMISLDYYDYGNTDVCNSYLTDADVIEDTEINGIKATVCYTNSSDPDYDPDSIYNGLVLIWVDDTRKLIFAIDSFSDIETTIRFAESIKAIE